MSLAGRQDHSPTNQFARANISFRKVRYSVGEFTDQSTDRSSMALKRSSRPDIEWMRVRNDFDVRALGARGPYHEAPQGWPC